MIETRVTKLLGIKYPILSATMRNIAEARLVAAVSNAGGLGILHPKDTPREMREEVRKTKSLTDKPFGVHLAFSEEPQWYYERVAPFVEEGVKIVLTTRRIPESCAKVIRDSGLKWIHHCARVRDARTAERMGADAVSIIGDGAAGNAGITEDVSTMVRLPATVDAVKIPVIAAGGIADARGFVATLALGAEGVMMGTRFACTKESIMHPDSKKLMIESPENATIVIPRPWTTEKIGNSYV